MSAEPLRWTTARWHNDVRDGKGIKKLAHKDYHYDTHFKYGTDTPSTWDRTDLQWAIVLSPESGVIGIDVDHPSEFPASAVGQVLSSVLASTTRWDEERQETRFHIYVDARGIPREQWPTQSWTAWGDIRTKSFMPWPGSVHYRGVRYEAATSDGTPFAVLATPELMEAMAKDIASRPEREGGGSSAGGTGGGHDGEMAAFVAKLTFQGLSLDEIRPLWEAKADEEQDPSDPYSEKDLLRHYGGAARKYSAFVEKTSWPSWAGPEPEAAVMTQAAVTQASSNGRSAPVPAADGQPPAQPGGQLDGDGREPLNVSNAAVLFDVLCHELGLGSLAGVFNRADELVAVPRYGEIGYRAAGESRTSLDPPAQVRPITGRGLVSFLAGRRWCYKKGDTGDPVHALPPVAACDAVAMAMPESWSGVPRLAGVTHTPLLRPDGSILSLPGYDEATGLLYLPETGLTVPAVPEQPSAEDVATARGWLDYLLKDFPFVTADDKTNYLGMLITPLLRTLLPPPWPQLALNAPQPGSGKTLLSELLRILYGGEEHPAPDAGKPSDTDSELRKVISTILGGHTGTVVVFDNLTGVLRSGTMAKLLTGLHWGDRELGTNRAIHGVNDRMWVLTGNNIQVGGDLPRRTIWCSIDARCEHPESRSVTEPDLPAWTEANRGNLLWAGLVLAKAAYPGLRNLTPRRTDSYGRWDAGIRHVLATAGVYGFWATETNVARTGADDEEWAAFLAAIYSWAGGKSWTARQLAEACVAKVHAYENKRSVIGEALPGDLPEALSRNLAEPALIARKLGKWLKNRRGRWADGYMVWSEETKHANQTAWYVKHNE